MKSDKELVKEHMLYVAKNINNKKPKESVMVGHKIKLSHVILGMVLIIVIALFMTGFGYQPWWLFGLIVLIGIFITLPTCFSGYWKIDKDGITTVGYSSNDIEKLIQLLKIKKKYVEIYSYEEIKRVEISYVKNIRLSPFDFNPDFLKLNLVLKNRIIQLELGNIQSDNLNKIITLLNEHGINVFDSQKIVYLLKTNKNLFNHFHNGKWASL